MSNPTGWKIALERIAAEAEAKTGYLGLCRLGLTEFPKELFELSHLQGLSLGSMERYENGKHEWDSRINIASNDLSSSMKEIVRLSELRHLSLTSLPVENLSFLTELTNLQTLDLMATQVNDLEPVTSLKNLQSLKFPFTGVDDLTPLTKLVNLQLLWLGGNRLSNMSPLAGLINLETLDCSYTQVSDLRPLAGLVRLESLRCQDTQVSDLRPLAELVKLKSLGCQETQVSNLRPLSGLINLKSFDCSFTQVSDLNPLAGMVNLQRLDCSFTQVSDLKPLAGLVNLRELDCRKTKISDLTPLSGLINLESLVCGGTQVSSLSPLLTLSNLQNIDASWCHLNSSLIELTEQFFLNHKRLEHRGFMLYRTRIPDAPPEVLSQKFLEDCLDALRAHYNDLSEGSAPSADVKLMVLGNGRIGKTQICRRLRGEDFDAEESSTHGVIVSSVRCPDKDDVKLHIWDFGGQDIYHGAHALFMRSNAIFLIVWTPGSENQQEHEHGGMTFRNYPLSYWVNYVKHLGGENAFVLIVQTRCDQPEDKARCPVPDDELWRAFDKNFQTLHYSAQTDLNRGALNDALAQAVTRLHNNQGVARIGLGRHRVKLRLEEMRERDAKRPPGQRQNRWLTQDRFTQICAEENGPKETLYLLSYLHNCGIVFHAPELLNDRIILDQQWALEAIYAVFNRDKCYRSLRQLGGRFTRTILDALVWRDGGYSKDEQRLFLNMMEACGVCFPLRKGNEMLVIETEYVAPDLLPERSFLQQEIEKQWDESASFEEAVFEYELLHQGFIRTIISHIGREAGVSATYWKGGVCVYEKKTRSHALIEQTMIDDSAGRIRVATQRGQALELLRQMIRLVTEVQEQLGLKPLSASKVDRVTKRFDSSQSGDDRSSTKNIEPAFGTRRNSANSFYVSYAWDDTSPDGKKREEIVNRLCMEAEEHGRPILRDKNVLGVGDSITKFMKEIGEGDRIFVILSDKYLKSQFCMFELFEIWRNSRQDQNIFLEHCRIYTLDDADIWSIIGRIKYAKFWQSQHDDINAALKEYGPSVIGADDFATFKLMQQFVNHIGDVLAAFAKIVQPRSLDDLMNYGLNDPPEVKEP